MAATICWMILGQGWSGLAGIWNRRKNANDERIRRLAGNIDSLVERDEVIAKHVEEIGGLRRTGAVELYDLCAELVHDLNNQLQRTSLELSPDSFSKERFKAEAPNLIQIGVRGRLLQFEFRAPEQLVSSENFRIPYVLEGSIRCLNQDLLDRNEIEERLLFYCTQRGEQYWRYFDPRTYQSDVVDRDYLILLLEELL